MIDIVSGHDKAFAKEINSDLSQFELFAYGQIRGNYLLVSTYYRFIIFRENIVTC
jgi:hypothetical protein